MFCCLPRTSAYVNRAGFVAFALMSLSVLQRMHIHGARGDTKTATAVVNEAATQFEAGVRGKILTPLQATVRSSVGSTRGSDFKHKTLLVLPDR